MRFTKAKKSRQEVRRCIQNIDITLTALKYVLCTQNRWFEPDVIDSLRKDFQIEADNMTDALKEVWSHSGNVEHNKG